MFIMTQQTGQQESTLAPRKSESDNALTVTREDLVALLNDDLAGEYQALFPT